jgi:Reverse transcriptase (RNA-dependent DNA polymerase)/gag-polypeptide of LTR copia-type/Zinc knuckle
MTSKTDTMRESTSSIKYYQLNDENVEGYYDDWRYKTMLLIGTKGWSSPFDKPNEIVPSTADVEKETATEAMKKMFKENRESHNLIAMSCSGIPLGLVRRAKGDVRDAIRRLDKKYAKKSTANLMGLLKQFTSCKLESTSSDPEAWFVELDRINAKLQSIDESYAKKDYEMKAHLLGNLPEGYEDVETKLQGQEDKLEVEDIEEEISNKWQRTFKKAADKKAGDKTGRTNVAMFADGKTNVAVKNARNTKFSNQFKGRCRKCGKVGHKKADCRSDKTGVCFECGKEGHFARDCPTKGNAGNRNPPTAGTGMFVGMFECNQCSVPPSEKNMWLLDSGASTHVVTSAEGLLYPSSSNESVRVGNGAALRATKQGTLQLKNKEGNLIQLEDVQVVPGFIKNIISLGKLSRSGNKISFSDTKLVIKNPQGLTIEVEQDPGTHLYYLDAAVLTGEVPSTEVYSVEPTKIGKEPSATSPKKLEIDINDAHELYGHLNYGVLKPLLLNRGYVIYQGGHNKKSCEACAYSKAKAKGVSKTSSNKAVQKGERLFMDISGPYKMSVIGNKFWVLIVDDLTRKAWSFFVKHKNEAKKVTATLLTLLKGARVTTKYLRCDNAGENIKGIKELCEENGIQIELTPPHSPQFNGVVERKFVTIRDRAQAMMLGAHLNDEHQGRLWAEAVHAATRLHNAIPNRVGPAPDEIWYGTESKILDHLVKWGRIGYVTNRLKQPKLSPKSTKMVCMGHAADHAGDVYRMYNPETNTVIETRDITWADWHGGTTIPTSLKMFAEHSVIDTDDYEIIEEEFECNTTPEQSPTVHLIPAAIDEGDDFEAGRIDNEGTINHVAAGAGRNDDDAPPAQATRVERELQRLNTWYNPTQNTVENTEEEEIEFEDAQQIQVHYVFHSELASDPGEPRTIGEALQSRDRVKWISAMKGEIENFLKRKAWKKVSTSSLKKGQKPISTKWVFKVKQEHDGTKRYKGRLVARGFVQVPGVDFNLTHSPVATDVSVKVVITITLYYEADGWEVEMLDIEAAFLEAQLDEDVHISWPEGLAMFGFVNREETEDTCLRLEKAMYGTVQAPLAFYKENAKHMIKIGMVQSKADPCVWYRMKDGRLWLIVAVYVDDILYSGPTDARSWFKTQVKTRFNIVDLGKLSKHLGVWYQKKKGKDGSYYELSMSKYQEEIVSDWEAVTGKKAKVAPTPAFPGESLIRDKDTKVLDIENFRKILGKAMWFCKKIMPECGNAIRELASNMDRPGEEHWKSLQRLIGYIAGNDPATLVLRKPRDLKIYGYVDSNWATNKENRKSVTGYVLTIGGCLVNWVSKSQPTVSLSSTEAEYIAASMCATEIKFIQMLLEEVVPNVDIRPATLMEDNTGCLFLIENQAVGSRTKHIDIKMHHIREMVGGNNPRLKVIFTPSESNFADPMTKNVTEQIYQSLVPVLKDGRIADVIYETVNREDVGKYDRRTKKPNATPKVGTVYMTIPEVSTARDHDRDSLYYSPGNGTGAPEGRNIDHMDKGRSDPIAYDNSKNDCEDSG